MVAFPSMRLRMSQHLSLNLIHFFISLDYLRAYKKIEKLYFFPSRLSYSRPFFLSVLCCDHDFELCRFFLCYEKSLSFSFCCFFYKVCYNFREPKAMRTEDIILVENSIKTSIKWIFRSC